VIGEGVAPVSIADFNRLRDFLYRATGISFEDAKYDFLCRRVQQRIEKTRVRDFRAYFALLQGVSEAAELQAFVNLVTINETYFFREEYQLRAIARSMLDEIVTRHPKKRGIRLWSMPCATGEEPYSLAIYLLEHWPLADEFGIEIVGSDIDTGALARARAARYGRHALRNVSEPLLAKYFTPLGNDEYALCDQLRESIDFTHVNLSASEMPVGHGEFDVILCRNLLIYFDDISRRRAVETLYESLRPGGFLCLGHSESMSRISNLFLARKFPDALVYQRPLEGGV
jgi:chemotaxis protein methyltransferase CheR